MACGSAPLGARVARRWSGFDRSFEELALAASHGARRLAVADATAAPLREESTGAVVCTMALMLLEPLDRAVSEIARVLRPGGRLVVVLPTSRPLRARDRLRYARLLGAIRQTRLDYPNDRALARLPARFAAAGLEVVDDARRRFEYPVDNTTMADEFIDSLYLPGVEDERVARARAVARRWVGSSLGVPLRRLVAVRRGGGSRATE